MKAHMKGHTRALYRGPPPGRGRTIALRTSCSPAEAALVRHFAAELGLSVSSYLMLAALRYGVHLPRALPLAAALQVGVLRKAPASYRRKGQDDEQLLAQVKADFTKQLKPVPSSLIRDRAEKLKALHDEQLLALPPEKGNPDDGELAGLYDFKRDIEEFVDPAEGDTREDLQARIDNLLKVR